MNKAFIYIGAALLMTLSAQASTKVYFKQQGDFIVLDDNRTHIATKQNYSIKSVSALMFSETESANKAFDQWKNCYESKTESVDFPIPWPVAHYSPFIDRYDVQITTYIDQNEKAIIFDEQQVVKLIQEAFDKMNQKTSGKCKVKSVLAMSFDVQSADGAVKESVVIQFAAKGNQLFARYTDYIVRDAYNIDATKTVTVAIPNFDAPISVFGQER